MDDLRRAFRGAEVTLAVPDPGPVVPLQRTAAPAAPGSLADHDPLLEVAGHKGWPEGAPPWA
eukprot:5107464-Lingulodinium_polyedra.AAC.1